MKKCFSKLQSCYFKHTQCVVFSCFSLGWSKKCHFGTRREMKISSSILCEPQASFPFPRDQFLCLSPFAKYAPDSLGLALGWDTPESALLKQFGFVLFFFFLHSSTIVIAEGQCTLGILIILQKFSMMLRPLHTNLTTTNTCPQVSSFQCLWLRFTGGWKHKHKRLAFLMLTGTWTCKVLSAFHSHLNPWELRPRFRSASPLRHFKHINRT